MTNLVTARDVMETEVVTLRPDVSLFDAWTILFQQKISGAPVVGSSNRLLGVISQTDLLSEAYVDSVEGIIKNGYYIGAPFWDNEICESAVNKLNSIRVREVMNSKVVQVAPEDGIAAVAVEMRRHHIHRVIVTEQEQVVGIISALDLLGVLESH